MSNWLTKLGLGLKKSSEKISGGISEIFNKKHLDDQTLLEMEELLIAADMGVSTTAAIITSFSKQKQEKEVDGLEIRRRLGEDLQQILQPCEKKLVIDESKKPFIIMMTGVNGAGKTTTIGKLASKFMKQGKKVSLIAADTFRAAAVEQLKIWGERSNVRVFSGEPNCDSAGLCYDGINQAIKQGDDIVFIDTAGRLQNKTDLMDELKKIVKVIKKVIPDAPHETLLTLDATTGQNAVNQVKIFKECIDVSGLIITKLDGTAKGGILIAIANDQPTPIYYIGVGESADDLDEFKANEFVKGLLGL